jgi:hypothetical protein
MAKHKKNINDKRLSKFTMRLRFFLSLIFIAKVLISINIGGAWLGADGENYLEGANALLMDGLFSQNGKLLLWPAGYPILIFILAKIKLSWTLYLLSILQSAIFSISIYFFCKEIYFTKLWKISFGVAAVIALNPTLSLASNVVGYESLTASGYLFILAIILRDIRDKNEKNFNRKLSLSSGILSFMCFLQPRLFLSILIIILWIFFRKPRNSAVALSVLSFGLVSFLPATLVGRNINANNIFSISNNLGYTLNIGAGPEATGGYIKNAKGVDCPNAKKDAEIAICVIKWQFSNPADSARLVFNRAKFFWSPWYGPEANGTMARNPWLIVNPVKAFSNNGPGYNLISGPIGKFFSLILIISQIALLLVGFKWIRSLGATEKIIVDYSLVIVLLSWLISAGTIGDHRFRIPIMTVSLFLQYAGWYSLRAKIRKMKMSNF